jgi:hypothetical protein
MIERWPRAGRQKNSVTRPWATSCGRADWYELQQRWLDGRQRE